MQARLLFIVSLIFFSCKKEKTGQTSVPVSNQPPFAIAGPDMVVPLPTDSVLLSGSLSRDPDGTISSYQWTKISGPSSFSILNAAAVQTIVRNLTAGYYGFELTVTDNKGLTARDTINVTVKYVIGTFGCNDIPINITNGVGSLTPFGVLSQAQMVVPAAAADKIVFAGGWTGNSYSNRADIYNLSTQSWTTANLSSQGYYSFTTGNKIFYQTDGGYDIYDAGFNSWSHLSVNPLIYERGPTVIAAGNKVFFAGGLINNDSASSQIDVYDISLNAWSTASLSEGRTGINTFVVGNKVFFTGGYKRFNPADFPENPSSRVDIYDLTTNTWAVSQLPQRGFGGNAATLAGEVFFSFENIPDRIFIYKISTDTWTSGLVSLSNGFRKLIVAANKLLIFGDPVYSEVDIYSPAINDWSRENFSYPGYIGAYAVEGNKVLMLINSGNYLDTKWVIYDANTGYISRADLNYTLISNPIVVNNEMYLGGGVVKTGPVNSDFYYSCGVWKFQF